MSLISVIVAVYNAEDYLERCVKSICAQTVQDIEIILVDDGSTDSSPMICRKMARSDTRIRVFRQENAGDGAARMKGVAEAEGQFLMFVDNDDTLPPRAAEILLDTIRKNEADMAMGDYIRVKNGNRIRKSKFADHNVISPGEYYAGMMQSARPLDHYYLVLWNKMFRTGIMRDNGLVMEARGFLNDAMLVMDYLEHARTIGIAHEPVYEYFYRPSSELQHLRKKSRTVKWKEHLSNYQKFDSFIRKTLSPEEYEKTHNDLIRYFTREGFPALTVILPAYNAAATLETCVTSILSQTMSDLELIIADDGSTDATLDIASEFAKNDERVKVLRLPHGGVSAARNAAIEEIRGRYVMFVDADDRIEKNTAERALFAVEGADMVVWDAVHEKKDGPIPIRSPEEAGIYTAGDYADRLCSGMNLANLAVWNKLFRRDIIVEDELYFSKLALGEDICFTLDYLCAAKSICVLHEVLYHYNDVQGSASYRESDVKDRTEARRALAMFMEYFDRYLLSVDRGSREKYLKRRSETDRRILSMLSDPQGLRTALLV